MSITRSVAGGAKRRPRLSSARAGVIAGGAVRDNPHVCQSARKAHLSNVLFAHLTEFLPMSLLLPAVFLSVPRYDLRLSAFQAKAGIKAKLAECFCDRDKAVVLGDVE